MDHGGCIPRAIRMFLGARLSYPRDNWTGSYIPERSRNLRHSCENELRNDIASNRWTAFCNRMRQLLVTITLLAAVSSQDSEYKKRFESPPEVDPNFWPVRGRRSHWDVEPSRFLNNLIDEENDHPDEISGREIDYAGYTSSSQKTTRYRPGPEEIIFDRGGELRKLFDGRRRHSCSPKRSISLVLPFRNYRVDEIGSNFFRDGHSGARTGGGGGEVSGRIWKDQKGEEDRSRRLEPLYVDEPSWIEIDYSHGDIEKGEKNEDPFFIARGKKIYERGGDDGGDGERQLEKILEAYTGKPFFVARGKKQTFDEEGVTDLEDLISEQNSTPFKRYQKLKFDSKIDSRYPGEWHRRIRRGISSANKEKEERERRGGRGGGEGGGEEVEVEKFSKDLPFSGESLTKDKNSVDAHFHDDNEIEDGIREEKEKEKEKEEEEEGIKGEKKYRKNIKKKDNNNNYYNNNDDQIVFDITNGMKVPSSSSEVSHRLSARGIFVDYEPRNSATQRDKHSNLQSILDEPFFISRGKKRGGSRDVEYLREVQDDELPIKKSASPSSQPPTLPSSSLEKKEPVMISDILKIYRGRETSSSYYGSKNNNNDEDNKNNNFIEKDNNNEEINYNKFKQQHHHHHHNNQYQSASDLLYELTRNRRGMLDDLLKSDDPFYVARGKRLQTRRPMITNYRIDDDLYNPKSTVSLSAVNNLSIFVDTLMHQTKLLRRLTDFAQPINH